MSVFEWNEKYSVHVKAMDEQHKKLFDLISSLHEAMAAGKGSAQLQQILSGLKEYANTHFADEEKYMASFKYSGLKEQKMQHANFIAKISDYDRQLQDKKIGLSIEVLNFLKDWLVGHIQETDAKYADAFHSHGMQE